jgi:DNA-binding IclR family transcriptional regulator
MGKQANRQIKGVKRVSDILRLLREGGKLTVSDISTKLGFTRGTIHAYLATLEQEGWVIKDNSSQYSLSLQYIKFAESKRNSIENYEVIKDEVIKISEESGERIQFAVEEDGKAVVVFRAQGERAIKTAINVGDYVDMHSTAVGKAILSYLSEEKVGSIIQRHGLTKMTEKTITSKDELIEELEQIQQQGFALDDEERISGIRCIATPLFKENDDVFGSISVSAPAKRITGDRLEYLRDQLLSVDNVVEINTRFS